MRVEVESYTTADGSLLPRSCAFDGRRVDVGELLDQWHGADYRYIKFRGSDDNLYILRRDDVREEWELTMYDTPRAQEVFGGSPFRHRKPRGNGPID